jgi:hypothetical protein
MAHRCTPPSLPLHSGNKVSSLRRIDCHLPSLFPRSKKSVAGPLTGPAAAPSTVSFSGSLSTMILQTGLACTRWTCRRNRSFTRSQVRTTRSSAWRGMVTNDSSGSRSQINAWFTRQNSMIQSVQENSNSAENSAATIRVWLSKEVICGAWILTGNRSARYAWRTNDLECCNRFHGARPNPGISGAQSGRVICHEGMHFSRSLTQ